MKRYIYSIQNLYTDRYSIPHSVIEQTAIELQKHCTDLVWATNLTQLQSDQFIDLEKLKFHPDYIVTRTDRIIADCKLNITMAEMYPNLSIAELKAKSLLTDIA